MQLLLITTNDHIIELTTPIPPPPPPAPPTTDASTSNVRLPSSTLIVSISVRSSALGFIRVGEVVSFRNFFHVLLDQERGWRLGAEFVDQPFVHVAEGVCSAELGEVLAVLGRQLIRDRFKFFDIRHQPRARPDYAGYRLLQSGVQVARKYEIISII